MITTIRTASRLHDPDGDALRQEIVRTLGFGNIPKVRIATVFRLEMPIPPDDWEAKLKAGNAAVAFGQRVLTDDLYQDASVDAPVITDSTCSVEIAYRPGVMNPEAETALRIAQELGLNLVAVAVSLEFHFYGSVTSNQLSDIVNRIILASKTVQGVLKDEPTTLQIQATTPPTQTISICELSDADLLALSQARQLFLSQEEMRVIQAYFQGIERDPTDAELELIAQTWSEHCGHKTFRGAITMNGQPQIPLMQRIKDAAALCTTPVLSAFVDNAGVIPFVPGWGIAGKVETHNSPSAIEPYGGAATGSGGVFRDPAGTGLGARIILSTDMFCFAPPTFPNGQLPPGCLPSDYLLRRVVAGVRDYGNRMGIPTGNGSVHFDPDFCAKPTVIVGAYGLIPEAMCQKGQPKVNDLIIAVGGRTGRDGIHGATFSSGEMTADTITVDATAVQIGNPIEEKRTFDALLVARDEGLIRAITDCGAGGFASAVGEMASVLGCLIDLSLAPLKYQGLSPWEILLSESQERMVVAIDQRDINRFLRICELHNVEATLLGHFTGDGFFNVKHGDKQVVFLPMEWLHDGLPQRQLTAVYTPPTPTCPVIPKPDTPAAWLDAICRVLGHWNVCSKEPIVRLYDHGVQGATALPPFSGLGGHGPNDAIILAPLETLPTDPNGPIPGIVVAHGLNPVLNRLDPFWGSVWAAVEAISNFVAVGGDITLAGLIDNFIWPFPDEESLGHLNAAVDALVAIMDAFGIRCVSGKDSLSSTFRFKNGMLLKIPPVLCISIFGGIPDIRQTVSADFKRAGSHIILIGQPDYTGMGGSAYFDINGIGGGWVPLIDLPEQADIFKAVHVCIETGVFRSCHDISEGGLITALFESCLGGNLGAYVYIIGQKNVGIAEYYFNETAGCFLAEVADEDLDKLPTGLLYTRIGYTVTEPEIFGHDHESRLIFKAPLNLLTEAWERPIKEVFG